MMPNPSNQGSFRSMAAILLPFHAQAKKGPLITDLPVAGVWKYPAAQGYNHKKISWCGSRL
jgi:hypothetical protein